MSESDPEISQKADRTLIYYILGFFVIATVLIAFSDKYRWFLLLPLLIVFGLLIYIFVNTKKQTDRVEWIKQSMIKDVELDNSESIGSTEPKQTPPKEE